MASLSGPLYPSTASSLSGSGVAWTSPLNVEVSDGVYASASLTSGQTTNGLQANGFHFKLPSNAIVDGILVEFQRSKGSGTDISTSSVAIQKAGTIVATKAGSDGAWTTGDTWVSYGGSTDTWGQSWSGTDIDNFNFGTVITATSVAGGSAGIDAIRISVWWHGSTVARSFLYKVYNHGVYLGNLPSPSSDLKYTYDINTPGPSNISVIVPVSIDTATLAPNILNDEVGNILTDEVPNILTDEGQTPIFALGNSTTPALIKNGNTVEVWIFDYWNPLGKTLFLGVMENIASTFGGDANDDSTTVKIYPTAQDLNNYPIRAYPYTLTADQTQNTKSFSATSGYIGPTWYPTFGQTFTTGSGVTNLDAITVWLEGTDIITMNIYDGVYTLNLLGTVSQSVSTVVGGAAIQFQFPLPIPVSANTQYFFEVVPATNILVYEVTPSAYSGGTTYETVSATNSAFNQIPANDLYFITYYGTGSTTGTFTSEDPTTGMLVPILQDYIARGGLVKYVSSAIQATGLSLTAGFNTNTILEGIQEILTLSPAGFYWYIDIGTNTLYFQQANTTADIVLTRGKHLNSLTFTATIEYVVNTILFTGGTNPGTGDQIYTSDQSVSSTYLYGPKLDRPTDSNVIDDTTAHTVSLAEIASKKNEQYPSTVAILSSQIDTTAIHVGQTIGFNGFNTFVDGVIAQIVEIQYTPEVLTLTLGILPKRLLTSVEQTITALIAAGTVNNPSTPS